MTSYDTPSDPRSHIPGRERGHILAIDAGQTATKALLAHVDGTVLASGSSGPMGHVFGGVTQQARTALDILLQSLRPALDSGPVAAAALGVTGVQPLSPEVTSIELMVREVVPVPRITVVPDYVANLIGATAGGPGVVVVAGGGAIAYGLSRDGREARAGGFGYLLGDEGSAYDIGRHGVTAAVKAFDGRGSPTVLEETIKDAFHVEDLRDIKRIVYGPNFSRDSIAALAPGVVAAAEQGDEVARQILISAARELAQAAIAVARELFSTQQPVTIYPTGGVFHAGTTILDPFRAAIQEAWPRALVDEPAFPPVAGTLILARHLIDSSSDEAWLQRVRATLGWR